MHTQMTITYPVHTGLYINLTNRCPCACTFCIRQGGDSVHNSQPLWLEHEPSIAEVQAALDKERLDNYTEIVFCGYGEPTEALDTLLQTTDFIKQRCTLPIRINTNGLGDLINGRHIAPLFKDRIDTVSISLNTSIPELYEKTVRPIFKEKAYPALLAFAQEVLHYVPNVTMTTVDTTISHEDEAACRKLCEQLGVHYRIRAYTPPSI